MTDLPSRERLLEWIAANPTQTSKRDIARAFGVKGAERLDLKRLLKELELEGHLQKERRHFRDPDKLPPVTVLSILPPDRNGDLFAKPLEWHGEGPEPRILYVARETDAAIGEGDRILGKLTEVHDGDYQYEARLIRRIGYNPHKILGIFRKRTEGGRILPVDKGVDHEWQVPLGATHGAKDGELVEAELASPRGKIGLPTARIVERLGDPSAPKAVSLIAIHQHGIPDDFPDRVMAEADAQKPAGLSGREDLRHLPFVTIDPSDARDHDDAVFAHADDDPKNPGGHVVWVAIADVAHYVRPGSALDAEARLRGNSTYFPDRVVPMLPDRLSGDLCSLHEGVPRACIALRMQINGDGEKTGHSFHRGLMRSAASLAYEEVQQALDGQPNDKCAPLLEDVLKPLQAAYLAVARARDRREPLDLDIPERRIELTDQGKVKSVNFRERLEAHRLIEEFMVLANVAASETLSARRTPLLFRVHEEPTPEKLEALRETAQASGFTLAKGQVLHTRHLNKLLHDSADSDLAEMINMATLRSMTQAYYSPENFSHFGLALKSYAHFTSPIRRYSDLIVHRGLISAHKWSGAKAEGLSPDDIDRLQATAEHISETERRSMMAERDTTDRYLAAYLSERVGNEFSGRISGVARFGLFVKLDETGADGLVPIRSLGNEFFHFDREAQTLMGADSGRVLGLGQRVLVRLSEAVPVTGGLMLELLELDGEQMSGGPRPNRGTGRPVRRKEARAFVKGAKFKSASYGDRPKTVSRGERSKPASYGSRPKSASDGDRPKSASDEDQPKSRSYGDRPKSASHGDKPRSGSFGDRPKPASYAGKPKSASYGDRPKSPSDEDQPKSRSYGDRPKSASHGDKPRSGSFGDRPKPASYGGKPRSASYGDRPKSASDEDQPKSRSYGDRPKSASHSDKPRSGSFGDRPKPASYGGKPRSASYGDRPKSASDEDQPKSRSYGDRPKSASHSDKPRSGSFGDRPKPASYGDKPRAASFGDKPKRAPHGSKPKPVARGGRPKSAPHGKPPRKPG